MVRPLLLTGFQPFDGEPVNPSLELLGAFEGESIEAIPVETLLLPVSFRAAGLALKKRLADPQRRPRIVLALGQAGGRSHLSLERIAVNLIDARIPDETGRQPIDQPVRRGGPAAYFATLPLKRMQQAARLAGVTVELSYSAGSFVCNAVMYQLLDLLAGSRIRAGFMHLPWLPEQAARRGGPALALAEQMRGLRAMLPAALLDGPDLKTGAGREH